MIEWEILGLLVLAAGASAAYALSSRTRYAPSVSLLVLASSMFGYASVAMNPSDFDRWCCTPPPWFVSRIVLATVALIVSACVWRARSRIAALDRRIVMFAAIAALIVPATLFSTALGLSSQIAASTHAILMFAILLTVMLWLAFVLTVVEPRLPASPRAERSAVVTMMIVCAAVSVLGFLEVALDIGSVRNMFTAGVVETRAVSTFLNPNWFALCLVPFVFLAAHLATQGWGWTGCILTAFATIGLVASGSRSVIVVLTLSICAFLTFGVASDRETRSRVLHALRTLIGGVILGFAAGTLTSVAMGEVATDRYVALVERIFAWPVLILTNSSVFQAVWGRLDIGTLFTEQSAVGAGIVDSAYIFLLGANPLVLVLLVTFLGLLTYETVGRWRAHNSPWSVLQAAMCSFIVLVGFVGQVYWAFPVWIALSVLLAWVLIEDDPLLPPRG